MAWNEHGERVLFLKKAHSGHDGVFGLVCWDHLLISAGGDHELRAWDKDGNLVVVRRFRFFFLFSLLTSAFRGLLVTSAQYYA